MRNWPLSPYLHVATESVNVISFAAAHEPALVPYVFGWVDLESFLGPD